MSVRRLIDYSVYFVARLLICLIQALPLGVCQALSQHLGWFCWEVLRFRRQVIGENLQIAFPEKSAIDRHKIALRMWQHLLLMLMEIAHAPRKIKRTTWRHYSNLPSSQEMLLRLLDERPLVVISGHLGNFEIGGYLLALHGFPTHTVARAFDNPYLDRFVNKFRGSTGQFMLTKQGSGGQITEVLDTGGTLVLLGDQFAGPNGCWVDFFGRAASTHKAVSVFTLGSEAPTAVSAALRRAGPLTIEMQVADIVDPRDSDFSARTIPLLTEWYTRHLENLIRQAPEQYWWVHRRWKGHPDDRQQRKRQPRAA